MFLQVCFVILIASPWKINAASVNDVLSGLSAPELKSLLKDLEYDQYNSALNALEYGEAPEYFVPPESEKNINGRTESLVRPVEGKPLFERPKGVIGNKEENTDKAAAAPQISHKSTTAAAEANAAAAALLPAYCDPPNPCPLGYTERDGCIENFENTSEFSRIYQARQKCICDTEHMFNCPENNMNGGNDDDDDEAEPRSIFPADDSNPYLAGQKLPVAAKKGMGF